MSIRSGNSASNPHVAIENRKKLVDRAATDKIKMLGYHWTYPGLGFAERKGYVFAKAGVVKI